MARGDPAPRLPDMIARAMAADDPDWATLALAVEVRKLTEQLQNTGGLLALHLDGIRDVLRDASGR